MRKTKYYAIFVKPIENSYELVGKKRINITDKAIEYSDVPYLLDDLPNQKPISKGLKKYYFIELKKGFISFKKVESNIDMEIVGNFISKNVISSLFSNLMNNKFGGRNYMDLILGGIVGLAIGFLLGNIVVII